MGTANRMKIACVVTRADALGGAQVHVLDLAEALISRGHEVTVLAGGDGPLGMELASRGIPFRSMRHLGKPVRPRADLRATLEIWRALRVLQPDLVAAHTAKAGMLARWAAAIAGVPAVFTPHGWCITDRISVRQGRLFRVLERFSACLSARIINVCEYERGLAAQYKIASNGKLAMVRNGLPDVPDTLFAQPDREPPRLIAVARFEDPKDHRTLLSGLSTVAKYEWTLDLIGDGPTQPEIARLAEDLGLIRRVRFLGARRDVSGLLSQAQIFVLSTRSEALPYSVLEAMRAGLPVVSSDVGGIREAVTQGETGILVRAKDPMALGESLRQLITKPELRRRMGNAGRRRFLQSFTIDKMVDDTLQVYREAITRNSVETRRKPLPRDDRLAATLRIRDRRI
jgi:glycosyltransferase involved in cell wall biosynthesis